MKDINDLLTRLGNTAVPARLASIDDTIIASINAQTALPLAPFVRLYSYAALGALTIGIASASFPSAPIGSAHSLTPFNSSPSVSTL